MKILSISWIFLLVLLAGCKKEQLDDCFSTLGNTKTIERPVQEFNKLNVGDKFKVILTQHSGNPKIRITAGENILEGIEARVENGELFLENFNTCNFVRTYNHVMTIEVFLNDLKEVFVYGACSISNTDTLHLDELKIDHSALEDMSLTLNIKKEMFIQSINSGGMTLAGKCNVFKASIEEITNIDARNLVCREVLVDTHTPLDCYVNATELLFVKIYNAGNVFYTQEPTGLKELNVRIGTGDLLKLP